LNWISDQIVVSGGAITPEAWQDFRHQTGVTAVVNLRAEREDHFGDDEDLLPVAYLWLPVIDHTDPSLTHLVMGVQFIHAAVEAGHKILIHCMMGVGRSRTMAAAYLIWAGHSIDDALLQVEGTTDLAYRPERRDLLESFAEYVNRPRRRMGKVAV
jgi:predicted protein tyrosine phosphatase